MNLKQLVLFVLGAALFSAVVLAAGNLYHLARAPLACEEPIGYTIGTFDRRFGISQAYFLDAIKEAEAIWEKAIDKNLFAYAPEDNDMNINLIYDYRQEVTSTLSGLESAVEEDEATYRTLQARYAILKSEYEVAKSVYDNRVKAFNEKNDEYQAQVEAWNRGSRNSRNQFNELERTRVALEAEVKELKILETRLNAMVREINSLVGTLNRLARSLNLNVETYNTIGASRGETFTGGIYYQAEGERGIDVYEFSSRHKLVRVLAHELGHALGLDHVDDPEAMMYHLNQGEAGGLSDTDVASLQTLCRIE